MLQIYSQRQTCERLGAPYFPCDMGEKVGVSRSIKNGVRPLNGMRISPAEGTCGSYIWAGEELSEAPDFFMPLHAIHLLDWAPIIIPYLGLPPGWRFLVTENYEDVWQAPQLKL